MKLFFVIAIIMSLLVSCTSPHRGTLQPTPTETIGSDNPSTPDDDREAEYIDIFSNHDYFLPTKADGVEIKYNIWREYDYFPYDNLNFSINKTIYECGIGMDGKSDDDYDKRDYGSDTYEVLRGKYNNIRGVFSYDDKTPVKLESNLVIFVDGNEHYRVEINEKIPYTNISVDIPAETKELTFRFEVKGKIEEFIPMLLFVNAKARKVE